MSRNYSSSLFLFALKQIFENNDRLNYIIENNKEKVYDLYPIVNYGLFQYMLYAGVSVNVIEIDHYAIYTKYIMKNYNEIYNSYCLNVTRKPKKLRWITEQENKEIYDIISNILLPYINEYCFFKYKDWKIITNAYIAELAIQLQWDINHSVDDSLKYSEAFPFLLTMFLINNLKNVDLYDNVEDLLDPKLINEYYNSDRNWKEKEVVYLQQSKEIIDSQDNLNFFLANFCISRWNVLQKNERIKTIFELSKIISICLKANITSITMLKNGEDCFDILEKYLDYFLFNDKLDNLKILFDENAYDREVFSPYNMQEVNIKALQKYINHKNGYISNIDLVKVKFMTYICASVLTKIKMVIIASSIFNKYVYEKMVKEKEEIWIDKLNVFTLDVNKKIKPVKKYNSYCTEDFLISEDEINEILNCEINDLNLIEKLSGFRKIGFLFNAICFLNGKTYETFNYCEEDIIKYILIVFGPHPDSYIFLNDGKLETIFKKYFELVKLYKAENDLKYAKYFDFVANKINK